ncbi:uncharacterized protein MELLADRAFT_84247 [Melampsora larici-populina 98AG31]|uniref:Uncharacterized protein n=1 Tax=Melampsora larici-populina (strain 98AG31 / pathotype 3-4-7) TaxID=747676 RepID=F4RF13_MELLP|nr:uncharacterized protein MELLADRAFT_84247 [Melampsora larici-populina 98AG31]EGG09019.1 hypothetical protein MELLADRAFT_84247 [Melampsora larici-populina 98AG31]
MLERDLRLQRSSRTEHGEIELQLSRADLQALEDLLNSNGTSLPLKSAPNVTNSHEIAPQDPNTSKVSSKPQHPDLADDHTILGGSSHHVHATSDSPPRTRQRCESDTSAPETVIFPTAPASSGAHQADQSETSITGSDQSLNPVFAEENKPQHVQVPVRCSVTLCGKSFRIYLCLTLTRLLILSTYACQSLAITDSGDESTVSHPGGSSITPQDPNTSMASSTRQCSDPSGDHTILAPDGMNSGEIAPHDPNTSMLSLKRQRSDLSDDHTILRGSSHHVHATSESPPRTRQRCESDTLAPGKAIKSQFPTTPASSAAHQADQSGSDQSSNPVCMEENETQHVQVPVHCSVTLYPNTSMASSTRQRSDPSGDHTILAPDGMNSGKTAPQDPNTSMLSLKRQRSDLSDDHTILRGSSHHVHVTSESPPRTRQRCKSDTSAPETAIKSQFPTAPASSAAHQADQSGISIPGSQQSSNPVSMEEKETQHVQDPVRCSATYYGSETHSSQAGHQDPDNLLNLVDNALPSKPPSDDMESGNGSTASHPYNDKSPAVPLCESPIASNNPTSCMVYLKHQHRQLLDVQAPSRSSSLPGHNALVSPPLPRRRGVSDPPTGSTNSKSHPVSVEGQENHYVGDLVRCPSGTHDGSEPPSSRAGLPLKRQCSDPSGDHTISAPDRMDSGEIKPQDPNTSKISLKRHRSDVSDDHTLLRGSLHHVHATSASPPRTRQRCESDTSAFETAIKCWFPTAPAASGARQTDQAEISIIGSDQSSNPLSMEEKETQHVGVPERCSSGTHGY